LSSFKAPRQNGPHKETQPEKNKKHTEKENKTEEE